MIKAGILGATGYAGLELTRLLLRHPQAQVAAVGSVSFEGKKLYEVYPSLREICGLECKNADAVLAASDVVFAALPHGCLRRRRPNVRRRERNSSIWGRISAWMIRRYMRSGTAVRPYHPELHQRAVYGLPELFREAIRGTDIVGNPGCYPTSVALGLAPALRAGAVETEGLVADAKSGTTGAGRGLAQNTHFPDCNEAFSAYKVAAHRHTPEIEQTLTRVAGKRATVTFVPHLLPVNRGILSTIYARLKPGFSLETVRGLYEDAYRGEPFVRVLPAGAAVNIRDVRCSNYCDIQLYEDPHTGLLIVTAVIDNMVKGAAGQAIQNMNLLFGLPETTGLDMIPPAF